MENSTSRKHWLSFWNDKHKRKEQCHVYSTGSTPSRGARPARRRVSGDHPHRPSHQYRFHASRNCSPGRGNAAYFFTPLSHRLCLYCQHSSPVLTLCTVERWILHVCISRAGATFRFHDHVELLDL